MSGRKRRARPDLFITVFSTSAGCARRWRTAIARRAVVRGSTRRWPRPRSARGCLFGSRGRELGEPGRGSRGRGDAGEPRRGGGRGGKSAKVSRTDPDASLATLASNRRPEPSYKRHAYVDDGRGVVLDVAVTVTADSGYAYSKVYGVLERTGVAALIPAKREPSQSRVPLLLFRYDARNDVLKCPRGKTLSPIRGAAGRGRSFPSMTRDCARRGAGSTT